MTETIVLGLIILALLGLLAWQDYNGRKERAKLINALVAKTVNEFRDLELTEKVKPITPPIVKEPDLIHESEISDEKFEEMIKREIA